MSSTSSGCGHTLRDMPTCSIADSPGWANKKAKYPAFFKNPRNIVLLGCADGVNPWKNFSTDSFLVVVFAVWNLPSEIRMKRENLILLGMTDSKPKNAELVYDLVVEELEDLWLGVASWDSAEDERFKLRAMLGAWCSDHPALCEVCLQPNEGTFASCLKCSLQGVTIKPFGDVKYSVRTHAFRGVGVTDATEGEGAHDIDLHRYTHAELKDKGLHIEVSMTHGPTCFP